MIVKMAESCRKVHKKISREKHSGGRAKKTHKSQLNNMKKREAV